MPNHEDDPRDPLNLPGDEPTDEATPADEQQPTGAQEFDFTPLETGPTDEPDDSALPTGDPDETLDFGAIDASEAPSESDEPADEQPMSDDSEADPLGLGAVAAAGDDDEQPTDFFSTDDSTDTEAIDESAATDEEEDAEPKPTVWERITSTDPYTVLLGFALLALILGVTSLAMELSVYDFDVSASQVQSVAR
jgi:hypothetical protein